MMKKPLSVNRRVAALLVMMATIGAVLAYSVATASADGRTLNANFCEPPLPHLCMMVNGGTFDAATHVAGQADLTLRPGTYWITVTDDNNFHNFALRSCPGNDSTALCDNSAANANAPVQVLSPLNNGAVSTDMSCSNTGTTATGTTILTCTYKIHLTHGTYRLICQAIGHESGGMFADIAVGGVGQV
jgi:hypothetical protein